MKKILTLTIYLFSIVSIVKSQSKQGISVQQNQLIENVVYQLFPTQNFWTFIKLDTRNGRMWQVQFSIGKDSTKGEFVLNSTPLVTKSEERNGRFTLYPTENIYTFLLLDQIEGTVVQVQWSFDAKKRGIVSIIEPIEK